MKLHELKPAAGSTHKTKRIGRGTGSGHGKTATRGGKGQSARTGSGIRIGFEGGQMPIQRRLPIRGFNNKWRTEYSVVNLRDLNCFEAGTVVTPELLLSSRIIRDLKQGIKVLGTGELDRPLTIRAHKVSESAAGKIVEAGGKIEVI